MNTGSIGLPAKKRISKNNSTGQVAINRILITNPFNR